MLKLKGTTKKSITGTDEQLTSQLAIAKIKIEELKSENRSLNSIQIEQSKAIKQLTNENELPLKIKVL